MLIAMLSPKNGIGSVGLNWFCYDSPFKASVLIEISEAILYGHLKITLKNSVKTLFLQIATKSF